VIARAIKGGRNGVTFVPVECFGTMDSREMIAELKDLTIRLIAAGDPVVIGRAVANVGWLKPVAQYERYLREQNEGRRETVLAVMDGDFAGYVTVNWYPRYAPLAMGGIPEIQDLNVLPKYRRRRIASRLVDEAEEIVSKRAEQVGIGVGLHPGYNAAQRMYVLRGYVPDGNGVTAGDEFVREGQTVIMDDELVLHFVKRLP
jgi:GNAT superfamily N-acetyltransferase